MASEVLTLHDCSLAAPNPCFGYGDEGYPAQLWFSPWFLSNCLAEYDAQSDDPKYKSWIDLPKVTWEREGLKVIKTHKDTGKVTIWMLTDQYDSQGHRLGVWPD